MRIENNNVNLAQTRIHNTYDIMTLDNTKNSETEVVNNNKKIITEADVNGIGKNFDEYI
jgi:hypothetical protein